MRKQAFTLVELIVVITILAILGTIAFISLQGYSKDARNSTRLSDMGSIKKVLELYSLKEGKYPEATGPINTVTYSGSTIWKQGTFGKETLKETLKLSDIPLDPLTNTEYTYSVLNTSKEYEIGGIIEGEVSKLSTDKANAAGASIGKSYVTGKYNGKVAKVLSGSIEYVLAVPTIINSDISLTDYTQIAEGNKLAYTNTTKLPGSYTGTIFNTDGNGTDSVVNSSDILLYSGDVSNIDNSTFIANLKKAYSGTTISNKGEISTILNLSDINEINNYVGNVINNNLGGNVVVEELDTTPPNDYIAYYPLTGTAEDKTGNNNGTENGVTYVADSHKGSVSKFYNGNGSEKIQLNNAVNFKSLSVWIKWDGSGLGSIISPDFGGLGSGTSDLSYYVRDDGNIFYYNGGENYFSNANLNANEWYYINYIRESNNTMKIYINGELDSTHTLIGSLYDDKLYNIGSRNTNDYSFRGNLSNLQIFNRPLSQREVTNIYNYEKSNKSIVVTDGLVGYYPLKNNSKDNWFNENDGTENGNTYISDSKFGSVASFDGINDYVDTNFKPVDGDTIWFSFWVNPNNTSESNYISNYDINLTNGSYIGQYAGKVTVGMISEPSKYYSKSTDINVNEWSYVVGGFNGDGSIDMYLNGEVINTVDKTEDYSESIFSDNNVIVGTLASLNGRWLNGEIANIRIYDKSLSLEEITKIYNSEK